MTTEPDAAANGGEVSSRRDSMSNKSDDSQTAAEFLREQEVLEADAREALPYSIENCTKILGPLRQNVFACLTCNPSPELADGSTWTTAGVCYACSVSCHGDHTLVEIFQKRNFTCDCGTTRVPSSSPCTIRTNDETNTRGDVHSEEPSANNKYNQNFRNRFCGCECDYDPHTQKGTMFQCLGLGSEETGGCGEDWYHPGCLVGKGPTWFEASTANQSSKPTVSGLETISEDATENKPQPHPAAGVNDDDPPMPPGFPEEDAFDGFICYKCVDSQPWIKKYAGAAGFLPPVFLEPTDEVPAAAGQKRKASPEVEQAESKRARSEQPAEDTSTMKEPSQCKLDTLPAEPSRRFSLFFHENFREKFCHCSSCYRKLNDYPQLLEEEETYEPPVSDDGESQHGGSTHGSGSLLERGESALRNVDRVRAIEGVMAYNHLKEQLKPFFQQFAQSGQAIGAEDIKAYFAKLRGDEEAIQQAGAGAAQGGDKDDDDNGRHEQSGY